MIDLNTDAAAKRLVQITASGTSVDFLVPTAAKIIVVSLRDISTSGTSDLLLQLGSGSIQSTGYVSAAISAQTVVAIGAVTSTSGLILTRDYATPAANSSGNIELLNNSGNIWTSSSVISDNAGSRTHIANGNVSLSGAIDRLRLTTVNGTDTFDNGILNVLWM